MYAIIEEGGRQFKVSKGERIRIDRPHDEKTRTVKFDRVLLIGGDDGKPGIGSPLVAGATVTAEVVGPVKGPKIDIQKYKRRKGYHKKIGHRQQYLEVKITDISQ